ncbi:glycosyltransferase family 39 protein [Pedobacter jamesrossensis]|uniref:glycosyltransferase family 39 protein n=1 Tax=Pedobacter jamesrossensis TaxID=1908238 RepID=UPI0036108ABE
MVSTPDTPLIFFWTLSLLLLHRALRMDKTGYWIFSGIAMGLAFDSKYTAVFLPFGLLLFLLLSVSHRRLLTTVWPWLCLMVMILVSAPVIVWNFQHDFASFAFQGSQRMGQLSAFTVKPKFIFGLLGHQLALLMPVLFITLFYGLYILVKRYGKKSAEMPVNDLFLLSFFLPVFLLFILISPLYWVKINWMMPAYISGILWASIYLSEKWFKWQILLSLLVHLGLILEVLFYPIPIRSDDTWVGWEELSEKVLIVKREQHADFVFSADGYKTSAELNLYSEHFIYGRNVLGEPALEFDFLDTDLSKLSGQNGIFIDSDPHFKDIGIEVMMPEKLKGYFEAVRQLPSVIIRRNNRPVRKFLVYFCEGYRPPLQGKYNRPDYQP